MSTLQTAYEASSVGGSDRLWTLCAQDSGLQYPESYVGSQPMDRNDSTFTPEADPGDEYAPCNDLSCNAAHLAAGDFLSPDGTDTTFDWGGQCFTTWTLEFWFKVAATEGDGTVVIMGDDYPITDFGITYDSGAETLTVSGTESATLVDLTGTVADDGCWHQVVWVYDGSDAQLAVLYIDGAEADSATIDYDDWTGCSIPSFLWFGTLGQNDSDVTISHIAFWQDVLPELDIADHWDAAGPCCEEAVTPGIYVGKIAAGPTVTVS